MDTTDLLGGFEQVCTENFELFAVLKISCFTWDNALYQMNENSMFRAFLKNDLIFATSSLFFIIRR